MKFPLMRNNILREDLDAVIEHLKSDDPKLTNGPFVRKFEEEWSKWLGVKYSVFVNSGASANLISMAILKQLFPKGGEIIVPPLTWVSDIASVIQNGFTPVFVDIDFNTLGMNTKNIINNLNKNTRAVFLSHIQGFNALSDELLDELSKKGIFLIEDVCESHGATHNNKKAGSFGLISNFSYYYAHHMTTIEGGMICTNDEKIFEMARIFRSHGMVRESANEDAKQEWQIQYPELNPEFIFAYPAYNVRNTEIGGILGLKQLTRLDHNIQKRTENFSYFISNLNNDIYLTDFLIKGSSNYAFNIVLRKPNKELAELLMRKMQDAQIEFRRGSAGGGNQLRQPYLQTYIKKNHWKNYPVTDHIHFFGFYIGNFPELNKNEIDEILSVINSI